MLCSSTIYFPGSVLSSFIIIYNIYISVGTTTIPNQGSCVSPASNVAAGETQLQLSLGTYLKKHVIYTLKAALHEIVFLLGGFQLNNIITYSTAISE